MTEIKNSQLRKLGNALAALYEQQFYSLASHRIKVALKTLSPSIALVDDSLKQLAEKYGSPTIIPGQYHIEKENVAKLDEEAKPIMDETFEMPKLKGITWDDIISSNAKISPADAEILEECGFLTGNPDKGEPAP